MTSFTLLFPLRRWLVWASAGLLCLVLLPSFALQPIDPPPAKQPTQKNRQHVRQRRFAPKKWRLTHKKNNHQQREQSTGAKIVWGIGIALLGLISLGFSILGMVLFPMAPLIILFSINIVITIYTLTIPIVELVKDNGMVYATPSILFWLFFQLLVWGIVFALPGLWVTAIVFLVLVVLLWLLIWGIDHSGGWC